MSSNKAYITNLYLYTNLTTNFLESSYVARAVDRMVEMIYIHGVEIMLFMGDLRRPCESAVIRIVNDANCLAFSNFLTISHFWERDE